MIKLKEILNEGLDLKKLETAIKDFQKKIKKQGRVTNARDEEHLKQLIKVYKQMGGRKIKEEKLTEKSAISLNLWIKEFERLAKKNRMKPVDFVKKHISKRKGMDNEVVKNVLKHFQKNEGKLNEDKSLAYFQHIGYDIFDSIQKLDKEMKKHSVAKKYGKIKQIIKGLYKLESDLGEAINDLDVPQSNRGYDKKRFKKR